jgi:hypothetical protein
MSILTLAAAVGAGWFWHSRVEAEKERIARAATSSPPAGSAAKKVHVAIEATPPTATLSLDDAPLAGNPFEGELPSDSAHHVVSVQAHGYLTETRTVDLSQPVDIKIQLAAAPTATPAPPAPSGATAPLSLIGKHVAPSRHVAPGAAPDPASPAPAPSPSPAPATSAASTSSPAPCNPPFYFDESGIKHVKPECLK